MFCTRETSTPCLSNNDCTGVGPSSCSNVSNYCECEPSHCLGDFKFCEKEAEPFYTLVTCQMACLLALLTYSGIHISKIYRMRPSPVRFHILIILLTLPFEILVGIYHLFYPGSTKLNLFLELYEGLVLYEFVLLLRDFSKETRYKQLIYTLSYSLVASIASLCTRIPRLAYPISQFKLGSPDWVEVNGHFFIILFQCFASAIAISNLRAVYEFNSQLYESFRLTGKFVFTKVVIFMNFYLNLTFALLYKVCLYYEWTESNRILGEVKLILRTLFLAYFVRQQYLVWTKEDLSRMEIYHRDYASNHGDSSKTQWYSLVYSLGLVAAGICTVVYEALLDKVTYIRIQNEKENCYFFGYICFGTQYHQANAKADSLERIRVILGVGIMGAVLGLASTVFFWWISRICSSMRSEYTPLLAKSEDGEDYLTPALAGQPRGVDTHES